MKREKYQFETQKQRYDCFRRQYCMYTAIHHYSNGTCSCKECGNSYMEHLTLDHINAEPDVYAKEVLKMNSVPGGAGLANALRKHHFPDGIQILCWTHNMNKGSPIKNTSDYKRKDRSHIPTGQKKCSKCKQILPYDAFNLYNSSKTGLQSQCVHCNRTRCTESDKASTAALINKLGAICCCCGNTDMSELSFEHLNNDGWKHRQELQNRYNLKESRYLTSSKFARYVLKDLANGLPMYPGLTVACKTCNCSRAHHGYCPHHVPEGYVKNRFGFHVPEEHIDYFNNEKLPNTKPYKLDIGSI